MGSRKLSKNSENQISRDNSAKSNESEYSDAESSKQKSFIDRINFQQYYKKVGTGKKSNQIVMKQTEEQRDKPLNQLTEAYFADQPTKKLFLVKYCFYNCKKYFTL